MKVLCCSNASVQSADISLRNDHGRALWWTPLIRWLKSSPCPKGLSITTSKGVCRFPQWWLFQNYLKLLVRRLSTIFNKGKWPLLNSLAHLFLNVPLFLVPSDSSFGYFFSFTLWQNIIGAVLPASNTFPISLHLASLPSHFVFNITSSDSSLNYDRSFPQMQLVFLLCNTPHYMKLLNCL